MQGASFLGGEVVFFRMVAGRIGTPCFNGLKAYCIDTQPKAFVLFVGNEVFEVCSLFVKMHDYNSFIQLFYIAKVA